MSSRRLSLQLTLAAVAVLLIVGWMFRMVPPWAIYLWVAVAQALIAVLEHRGWFHDSSGLPARICALLAVSFGGQCVANVLPTGTAAAAVGKFAAWTIAFVALVLACLSAAKHRRGQRRGRRLPRHGAVSP